MCIFYNNLKKDLYGFEIELVTYVDSALDCHTSARIFQTVSFSRFMTLLMLCFMDALILTLATALLVGQPSQSMSLATKHHKLTTTFGFSMETRSHVTRPVTILLQKSRTNLDDLCF